MEKILPYFSPKPWAGSFIENFFKTPEPKIGEAWLLSTLKDGESLVSGKKLSEVLGHELSFLVKIIDASSPLSIQVHPNDHWAQELENSRGKTECWLILHTEKNAGVYLGTKEGVDEKKFRAAVEKNESVEKLMNFIPVSRGDFISVPAGTIHAIGPGVTLMEVQQSSGITYRIWDWGREGRELHLEKAMQVSDFSLKPDVKKDIFQNQKEGLLLSHKDFKCFLNSSEGQGYYVSCEDFAVSKSPDGIKKPYLFVR